MNFNSLGCKFKLKFEGLRDFELYRVSNQPGFTVIASEKIITLFSWFLHPGLQFS
jgi:hypothetical protein